MRSEATCHSISRNSFARGTVTRLVPTPSITRSVSAGRFCRHAVRFQEPGWPARCSPPISNSMTSRSSLSSIDWPRTFRRIRRGSASRRRVSGECVIGRADCVAEGGRTAAAGVVPAVQHGGGRHGRPGGSAPATVAHAWRPSLSRRDRRRSDAPVQIVVQPRVSHLAAHRLANVGRRARAPHSVRSRPPDSRVAGLAAAPRIGSPLLCVLSSGVAAGAADLHRGRVHPPVSAHVQPLLDPESPVDEPGRATCAVFYRSPTASKDSGAFRLATSSSSRSSRTWARSFRGSRRLRRSRRFLDFAAWLLEQGHHCAGISVTGACGAGREG